MTASKRQLYRLMILTVALLVAVAFVSVLDAHAWTRPAPPAPSPLLAALLRLLALTGLLAGGLYAIAAERADGQLIAVRWLLALVVAWALLPLAWIVAHLALIDAARPLLVAEGVLLGLWAYVGWRSLPAQRISRVWCVALAVDAGLALLLVALDTALLAELRLYTAQTVMALALGYWLMHRFSNITPFWRDQSIAVIAPLLATTGVLLALAPEVRLAGFALAVVAPLALMLTAAHSYRALSDRNSSRTLAAHWTALALILWLLALGALAPLTRYPDAITTVTGTQLDAVRESLAGWALVAVGLGTVNQAVAEMRGQNRRITGLLPFWLVCFGLLGAALALAGAGLVQVYVERLLNAGAAETHRTILTLYRLRLAGTVAVLLGTLIYALGFTARRL
ncbi:MAG: hypothetical protein ACOCZH_05190 [Phototrophicaceae bacterium]